MRTRGTMAHQTSNRITLSLTGCVTNKQLLLPDASGQSVNILSRSLPSQAQQCHQSHLTDAGPHNHEDPDGIAKHELPELWSLSNCVTSLVAMRWMLETALQSGGETDRLVTFCQITAVEITDMSESLTAGNCIVWEWRGVDWRDQAPGRSPPPA